MHEDTYIRPPHGWTCFHCGETFTTYGAAKDHFGARPSDTPACRIKAGHERGLVMALRKSEAEVRELKQNVCNRCDQQLASRNALKTHKWLAHQIREND